MSRRAHARAAVEQRAEDERIRRELDAEHMARRADTLTKIPPPLSEGVCGHGTTYGRGGLTPLFEAGGAWAGGVGFCECCRSQFGYIAEAVFSARSSWSRTPDDTLCTDCGGVAVEVGPNPWRPVDGQG